MSQTIQTELNDILAKFAKDSISQPQIDPFTPADGDPVITPPSPAPAAASVNAPPAPATAPSTVVPPTPVAQSVDTFEDWEGEPTQPAAVPSSTEPITTPVQPDFSEIAKVLGKEDVKEKEAVIAAVNELKQRAEQLQSAPEDLVKAIEIAKLGGNYLEYLQVSVVDWAKEDPLVLYENYVEDQFYDANTGLVDYEKVDKILEGMTDEEKEFRGKELQKQYVAYQQTQKRAIQEQASIKRNQFEQSVRQVVNELNDVNGFAISPTKKAELLEYVLSGADLKESDVKSRVINAFVKQNFDKISSFLKTKVRNSTQRELLQEAQVPNIKPSDTPLPAAPTQGYSLNDYIKELEKKRGF